jgi:transcriptional regulator with XRE-family HTH domain
LPTPPQRTSPNVAVRRLARTLKALRTDAGLSQDQVRDDLELSQGKLSRLENGNFVNINLNDVRALLNYYKVPADKREALLDLARASRKPGWWETYDSVLGSGYAGFEQEAASISTYQPLVIPGLLQTAAYADAAIRGDQITDPQEIEHRLAFRMKRQEILTRPEPPHLSVIIDQAALARPFGGADDRRQQLQRLVDAGRSAHIDVRLIPFAAGMHAGLACGFTILDYTEDPSIAYVEMGGNALYLETAQEIEGHRLRFQRLRDTALDAQATAQMLSQLMNDVE